MSILSSSCTSHPISVHQENPIAGAPPYVAKELRHSVEKLAGEIGERNVYRPNNLQIAQEWIENELRNLGYQNVQRLPVEVEGKAFGLDRQLTVWNIEAMLSGSDPEQGTIVIGAHYDSKVATPHWHDHSPPLPDNVGTPGANDNASGVAAMLSLASLLRNKSLRQSLRFVAFVNEEPPFYQTSAMGSVVYARMLRKHGIKNVRMISTETMGCYSPRRREKRIGIASLFGLPDSPNYVAFLGNMGSRKWIEEMAQEFSKVSRIDVRTLALPALLKKVSWSDDWSFWQVGFPAFTVTDTAFLRHDDYHELDDLPENLDFEPMAEVVWALALAIEKLAS